MIRWLRDIWYVIFRYREYLADQEYAALEMARLDSLAGLRILLEIRKYGDEEWDTIVNTDTESAYQMARYFHDFSYSSDLFVHQMCVIRLRVVRQHDVSRETVTENG